MWQVPRVFLKESLKHFFGAPNSRWPVESSPYKAILSRRCPLPFLRHTLPSVAVTSATCWWFLTDQGLQQWWRSYFSECWGWCGDSADGSAQGVVDGGGRFPMTQSRTGGWWVRQLERCWSKCPSSDACCSILFCRVYRKRCLLWPVCCKLPCRSWHLMWWYTPG